jgi:drug/metabolite transporter (DMT)-like permease
MSRIFIYKNFMKKLFVKFQTYEGILLACLSGAFYGTLAILGIDLIRNGLSICELSFWRFFVASLLTFIVVKLRKEDMSFNRSACVVFIISAVFYSAATGLYFWSMESIGSGLAMVLFFLFPLPVVFFELIFDKIKPSKSMIIAFFAILIGLLFLADFSFDLNRIEGIIIGLMCALFFGVYFYVSQKYIKKMSLWAGTFWICFGNLIGFAVAWILQKGLAHHFSFQITLDIFLLAIITTILPIYFVYRAMRFISASMASILSVFEPIVTIILGWLFLNECLSVYQMVGIFVILVSVVYIHLQEASNLSDKKLKQAA